MVYSIPRDYTEVSRIRAQLDAVARAALAESLRASMQHVASDDPSLWFVRRMDVAVVVNAAWNHEQIADAWSRRIQTAVQSTIARGAETESVVRFDDEAAYLRQFLLDIVHGAAWSRWYYRRFEGLRALAPSGVIRSALAMHPPQGRDALAAMAAGELRSVIETLTPADAIRGARALADGSTRHDARGAALDALEAAAASGAPETCVERVALNACIESARAGQHPGADFLAASLALAQLRSLLRSTPRKQRHLLDAIAQNRWAAVAQLSSMADAELLAALTGTSRTWLDTAAQRLTKNTSAPAVSVDTEETSQHSMFGGLFLLLPLLADTDFETPAARWPHCDGTSPGALLRFLVALAACSGNVPRDWYDLVAREVLGVALELRVERAREWCGDVSASFWTELVGDDDTNSIPPGDVEFLTLPVELTGSNEVSSAIAALASRMLRRFSCTLPGFSTSSAAHLFVNVFDIQVTLEHEPNRRVVRRSRPPLDLILRMARVGYGIVPLPWDSRPVAIFPAET
jgi:hypothetical protein